MVERIPPAEEHFGEQECGFWSLLSSRLHFLSLLNEREKGLGRRGRLHVTQRLHEQINITEFS